MPRNSAGVYSVPNVFTPNTVISSSQVNANFSDSGQALTNSLDRQGRGGMQANLNLGGFRAINSGDPVGDTDLVTLGYYEDSANLPSNVALKDENNIFEGQQTVSATTPAWILEETDGGTGEKNWRLASSGSIFEIRALGDSGALGEAALQISRSSLNVSGILFPNGAVSIADSLAIGSGQTISDSDNIALKNTSNEFIASGTGNPAIRLSSSVPVLEWNDTDNALNFRSRQNGVNFLLETGGGDPVFRAEQNFNENIVLVDMVPAGNAQLQYKGEEIGFRQAPIRNITGNSSTAADDGCRTIRMQGAGATLTLDSDPPTNAVVGLLNTSGNDWTITASGTLVQAGTGNTSNRTIINHGLGSAFHLGSGNWYISGIGII